MAAKDGADAALATKPDGQCKEGALPEVASVAKVPSPEKGDGAVSFQESVERLQALRGEAKASPSRKNGGAGVLKRPALKTKPQKKPCAKETKPKRKARGTAEEREAMKDKLWKVIPKRLRTQYMEGCARCRWAPRCTPSCWALRGYSL